MNLVFSSYVFEPFIYQIDKLMVIKSRELSIDWQRYLGIVLVKRKNRIINSTLIDKHMISLVLNFYFCMDCCLELPPVWESFVLLFCSGSSAGQTGWCFAVVAQGWWRSMRASLGRSAMAER